MYLNREEIVKRLGIGWNLFWRVIKYANKHKEYSKLLAIKPEGAEHSLFNYDVIVKIIQEQSNTKPDL
jgi:hypothetical protein